MALLGTFSKQPGETLQVDIDYTTALPGSATITGTPVVSVSPSGAGSPTTAGVTVNGNIVFFRVSGGTDAQSYKLTILTSTNNSLVFEDEINVTVAEV